MTNLLYSRNPYSYDTSTLNTDQGELL